MITASSTGLLLLLQPVRELDDQNAVRSGNADQHQHAHQRHHVERGVGERQDHQHADEAHGNRQHDQERIHERTELRHQDQVQQDDRQRKADGEALERRLHALHHAAQVDAHVAGNFMPAISLSISVGDLAQVFAGRRDVDVGHALNLVMVHFGGRLDVHELAPPSRAWWAASDSARAAECSSDRRSCGSPGGPFS